MKLLLACPKCLPPATPGCLNIHEAHLIGDHVYQYRCPEGHTTTFIVQGPKHELLFNSACHSLIEGYYLEAVLGFSVALERFYEFYTDAICIKHNISYDAFNIAWTQVRKSSERQYGVFLFAYLFENKKPFDEKRHKIDSLKKMRNDAAHSGISPGKENAFLFGKRIFNIITGIISDFEYEEDGPLYKAQTKHFQRCMEIQKKYSDSMSVGIDRILAIPRDNRLIKSRTFDVEIDNINLALTKIRMAYAVSKIANGRL